MIPRKNRTKQPKNSLAGPDIELTFPANDDAPAPPVLPAGPARCPTCGRLYFEARHSGKLDMVLLAKDVLSDLQAALEAEVLP
jgi:hypothetical protein